MPELNPWIVRPKESARAARRLFCFPYAGAGISAFRGWPEQLASDMEVCLVQPPGRENRFYEAPLASISQMVAEVARNLIKWIDRPYALYGHSLGAVTAFETVRFLRRQGIPGPMHLFVSASRAPQLPWPHPPIHRLADSVLLAEIHRRYGSIPRQLLDDAEMRALLVPALRADFQQIETYCYAEAPPLACPISVFGGRDDPMVTLDALAAWQHQTRSGFDLKLLPGTHLFLQTARLELLQSISAAIAGSQEVVPAPVHE